MVLKDAFSFVDCLKKIHRCDDVGVLFSLKTQIEDRIVELREHGDDIK